MIQLDDEYVYSAENDKTFLERSHGKKAFYEAMKNNGFDFDDKDAETYLPKSMISVFNNDFESIIRFNVALENIHKAGITNIVDALSYLLEDWFDEKELMPIIQTNTLNVAQRQAKPQNNIKKPKTALKKFLK